jgi:hypothetical protein
MDTLYPLVVSGESCRQTLARLDARWSAGRAARVVDEKRAMTYIPDAASYSVFHTCNSEVAGWLRDLGCRVDGPAITSDISVWSASTGAEIKTAVRAAPTAAPPASSPAPVQARLARQPGPVLD